MRRAGRSDAGFTLLELAVVVVILGILLGIAVPSITQARASSQESSAKDDLAQGMRAVRECAAIGGALPASDNQVTGPGKMTFICGTESKTTTTLTISDSSTVTYYPPGANIPGKLLPAGVFQISVTSQSGKIYPQRSDAAS